LEDERDEIGGHEEDRVEFGLEAGGVEAMGYDYAGETKVDSSC
jgi:hypothetical protein